MTLVGVASICSRRLKYFLPIEMNSTTADGGGMWYCNKIGFMACMSSNCRGKVKADFQEQPNTRTLLLSLPQPHQMSFVSMSEKAHGWRCLLHLYHTVKYARLTPSIDNLNCLIYFLGHTLLSIFPDHHEHAKLWVRLTILLILNAREKFWNGSPQTYDVKTDLYNSETLLISSHNWFSVIIPSILRLKLETMPKIHKHQRNMDVIILSIRVS